MSLQTDRVVLQEEGDGKKRLPLESPAVRRTLQDLVWKDHELTGTLVTHRAVAPTKESKSPLDEEVEACEDVSDSDDDNADDADDGRGGGASAPPTSEQLMDQLPARGERAAREKAAQEKAEAAAAAEELAAAEQVELKLDESQTQFTLESGERERGEYSTRVVYHIQRLLNTEVSDLGLLENDDGLLPALRKRVTKNRESAEKEWIAAIAAKKEWDDDLRNQRQREIDAKLEQYVPSRLLQGLLPATLLETNDFYQDLQKPRVLRGYPLPSHSGSENALSEKDEAELLRKVDNECAREE